MYPTLHQGSTALSIGYFVWHKEWSSRLFARWFVLQGLEPEEAARRTFRFSVSATIWGWVSVWVMLFGWFIVYACGAGMLLTSIGAYWLRLPSHSEYASGYPYDSELLQPFGWALATAAGVFILWGYMLLGNKLWKSVSHDLLPNRDHWWQFHPRPKMVQEVGLNVTPQDKARDLISTVLIKFLLFAPLVATLLTITLRVFLMIIELFTKVVT